MHVCVVCKSVCVYARVSVYACACVCIDAYTCTCVCTCTHSFVCTLLTNTPSDLNMKHHTYEVVSNCQLAKE